jgi:hypothetical protein
LNPGGDLPEYGTLTDDELLNLAQERDQLTDEARVLLDSELTRRRLGSADVTSYREESASFEEAEELKRAKFTFSPSRGLGKRFYGKARRRRDPSGRFEEYDSTLWFMVLYFPVFPIASFTVRRIFVKWHGMTVRSKEIPIKYHPRDWNQILLTWVKAMATLLLLRIIFLLFEWHPEWLEHRF